ncbi:MAG: Dabb family protein [Bacteroidia bacterium]
MITHFKILITCVFFTIVSFACKTDSEIVNKEVTTTTNTAAVAEPERFLMHDVFLDLKDSIAEKEIEFAIEQIKRLKELNTIHWLHVGKRAETGDARLNANYDIALHVVFKSIEDLHSYDKDSTHANVRSNIKNLLAGPPVVFDYWTE